ncbi:hypothetical protein RJT34_31249 [Clitoria ternatea]|uniref:Uncharacterized protein n=1 Tax=Clitoria ternatea TaxID=43366 RepID=A0AAN9EYA0_CLITE
MAGFEEQVKNRARELKVLLKKGVKIVGDSCKKGWNKVKHIKQKLVSATEFGDEKLIPANFHRFGDRSDLVTKMCVR